jgi:hypothetical protein
VRRLERDSGQADELFRKALYGDDPAVGGYVDSADDSPHPVVSRRWEHLPLGGAEAGREDGAREVEEVFPVTAVHVSDRWRANAVEFMPSMRSALRFATRSLELTARGGFPVLTTRLSAVPPAVFWT